MYKILYMDLRNYLRFKGWILLLVAPILLTSCDEEAVETAEEILGVPVFVESVQSGLRRDFTVSGEVTADQSATMRAEFRADVIDIMVKPGEFVTKGQELLTMQSDNVRARYSTANASYTTAAQNLEQTRITNRKNVESSKAALETAESSLATLLVQNEQRRLQAQEALKSAEINLDLSISTAQTNLGKCHTFFPCCCRRGNI